MSGAAHWEIYEAFEACKNLGIGINYTEGANLKIFPSSDLGLSEEDRKPFFLETLSTVNVISKRVTHFQKIKYTKMIEENKYRRVVYKALVDQPISNFMLSNCLVPFNNGLFKFKVKARNQALVTPFLKHLLFNEGNRVCRIWRKDRQETIHHILNVCPKYTGNYTERHNMVVKKLEEAINLLAPNHKGIFKNKIITIDKELTKNDRVVKSQIRPDIWFWSEHLNTKNQIPDNT
jgi:hypothetical protein